MKKYRLKRWVKNLLLVLVVMLLGCLLYNDVTYKQVEVTPVGNYTCHGRTLKFCNGSKEVYDFLKAHNG